jgi:hypothetical protein
MGQQVVTLMYGISSKTRGLCTKDAAFWDNYEGPPEKRYPSETGLRWAYEGGAVGFAVASGPAYKGGEGYLGTTVALAEIEKAHGRHIRAAKKKWEAFAKWAKKEHGKDLPPAQLWLTTDERA